MVDAAEAMKKSFLVPEIRPLDQYDFSRAKICSSLAWVLSKSYGADHVPEELREPFYTDQYDQEHIKPPVIRLLLSSDIYCRACRNALPPQEDGTSPRDNAAVLQVLARRGLVPTDQDQPVKEADLRWSPIKMGAHLAMIDALMAAFGTHSTDGLSVPSGGEQSSGAWEHKLLCWVDKINRKLHESAERELSQRQTPTSDGQAPPAIRYRKDKVLPKQTPCFPGITGVKDLANGCAIAATIHFYCPEILRLEDVCLKETMSVADSLYNLQLIQEFCVDYLIGGCPLTLEDLLYVPPVLKTNIGAFLAELYLCFEVVKPEFVQPKEMAEIEGSPGFIESPSPISGNSQSASPVFTFRHPLLPGGQSQSPGSMQHSTSMSQVEGFGKTWSKKQLSHPLSQAVSFSIPFGLDSDVDIVMGNPVGMMRSVSSDSLAPKPYSAPKRTNRSTYMPTEDIPEYTGKDDPRPNPNGQATAPRTIRKMQLSNKSGGKDLEAMSSPLENGPVDGLNNHSELPTIEEALQIIHSSERLEPRLHPEGAADGFYLHSPEMNEGLTKPRSPRHSRIEGRSQEEVPEAPAAAFYRLHNGPSNGRSAPETHRMSRDDDSVLRDNSLDSDMEDGLRPPIEKDPGNKDDCTSCHSSLSSQPDSSTSSSSGVKMTSFAERKKKLSTDGKPSGSSGSPKAISEPIAIPTTTWAQKAEESPSKSPALNSEMNQLGARLEEKRRAIEAQKKRIEAIFTKHRQRLGKSAFLQLKKKDGLEGEADPEEGEVEEEEEEKKQTLQERLSRIEDEEVIQSPSPRERKVKEARPEENNNNVETLIKGRPDKQVTFSPEITKSGTDDNLGDYNRAVAKLNSALSSLQVDMQRLSDQQQKLMHQEKSKAWVIPAPSPKTPVQRTTREFVPPRSVELSSSSPSPSPSRRTSAPLPKSPQPVPKRPPPPIPKSPKHTRPVELKIPPLTRVLTPPNNVDTLPRLRKFSPSKVTVQTRSSLLFSDDEYAELASIADGAESDIADMSSIGEYSLCMDNVGFRRPVASVVPQSTSTSGDGTSSEVSSPRGKRSSLIEIPLSALRLSEDSGGEGDDSLEESIADESEPGQRGGVGFFFKDERKPEDEMAQRRAILLERQQKRVEEARKRKQWLEAEKEQKKEETKQQEEEKPKEEEMGARRGDFTRQEHQRRQQLKIMEDLDKVLRQKPTTVRAVKKGRPKTVFRDDSVLSRSPVRGLLGSKLSKVYSQSTMSLSTVGNDAGNMLSVKRSPRSPRAGSPSGLMSPSRMMFSQNGERDWENASTASSPASIPEYTGPKLYKEPSAKSNKFIIHNALSHCCLAGKVNESQKNKTLEEMEKSSANHFLILFRDASCQFRAVYSFSAEMDEFTRLTGYGPKTISRNMIEGFYKYSSDRKRFTPIPSKTMSMSVDAVTIQGQFWQAKRPTTPKRPGTPK